jgi:hypothetical protein
MTLDEAIASLERGMSVLKGWHYEDDGRTDPDYSAEGSRYRLITSGGEIEVGEPLPAWFTSAEDAAREWLGHAAAHRDERGGKRLFWRDKPAALTVEFTAIDQAAAMNDAILRGSMVTTLHCVVARLSVSKADGEKEPK